MIRAQDVGIRFHVPRRGRMGRVPRLIGARRWTLWGLRNVDLEVAHGEVVGLIGPNGSGKTTLLKTIAGIYEPDEGTCRVVGRVAPLLSAAAGLKLGLSGWENIDLAGVLLGLSRKQVKALAPSIAEFAGIQEFMDAPARVYSSGMRARLGFAIAIMSEPDILVLDEVMGVGDQEFREKSRAKIDKAIASGKTVVMASHDVEGSVREVANRLVHLEHGRVVEQGAPDVVAAHYVEQHHASDRAVTGGRTGAGRDR